MTRSLLILTSSYPFGTGGDFLEPEIAWHSAAFDRVVVLPLLPHGPREVTPPNVEVDLSLVKALHSRGARVLAAVRTPRSRRLLREAIATGGLPPSFRSWLHLLAAVGMADRVHAWCDRHVEDRPELALSVWAGPATLGSARSGIPTVTRAHGGDLYAERHPLNFMPMQRLILESTEAIHPVSAQGMTYLLGRFPELSSRISVRHLGVRGADAVALASSDGVLRVVSCSSLTAVKRPRYVAAIIREMGRSVTVQWEHFGSGPLEGDVREIAADFPASVTWTLHGQVPNGRILERYAAQPVDIFLNASSSEGVPVSIMEAMSAGIPTVAPNVGGIGEIVNDRNGVLVEADAGPTEVAARVLRAVAGFGTKERQAIRDGWATGFSADANYKSFAQELCLRAARRTS